MRETEAASAWVVRGWWCPVAGHLETSEVHQQRSQRDGSAIGLWSRRLACLLVFVALSAVSGCTHIFKKRLVHHDGRALVCQARGFGSILGTLAEHRYERCVAKAENDGFYDPDLRPDG